MFDRVRAWAIVLIAVAAVACPAAGDPGYGEYTSWADWARLSVGRQAGLASSYDRSGGNADYSHYEWPEGLVRDEVLATVRTIAGPGMIYRFWMPHLTANRSFVVRMYFDGEVTPRIDTTSDVVLAGAYSHFSAPLVDTCAGGQVCYEPIPFAESLRIETINHELPGSGWSSDRHYYQYSYATFPAGTAIDSYTGVLSPQQQAARANVVDMFARVGEHPAGDSPSAVRVATPATSVAVGECVTLADLTGSGTIRGLNLRMDSGSDDELGALRLVVRYDDEASAAIDVAVGEFFGAGRQRATYASLPIGTASSNGFYSYWPMPFRESVRVELCNAATSGLPIAINSAGVEHEPGSVGVETCYLHANSTTTVRVGGQIYHPMLSATGRGHYVGNLLYVEQDDDSFYMLEGDEVIVVDGGETLYGTGLEDAYNGGFYYNWVGVQPDEPEGPQPQSATRPLSGTLFVHREDGVEHARADQYRWYIADRVPFSSSIDVKIENRYAAVGARWTSVAFWYQQPPVPGDDDGDGDLDLCDFAAFQGCFGQTSSVCTERFDFDTNGVVDLPDCQSFVDSMTGPW